MGAAGMGWIITIIVGGIAGWIASSLMKSNTGLIVNVLLGVVGAALANWAFQFLGVSFGGVIGYLVAGVLGAAILIAVWRAIGR